MLGMLHVTGLLWALGILCLTLLIRFLLSLHTHRTMLTGLPGPPHNYILGSLISMAKVVAKQPTDAAPQTLIHALKRYFNLPDVFYFDPWPLGPPLIAIFNVDMMNEVLSKSPSIPKHPVVDEFMQNFGGPKNLVSTEGPEWRKWRSAFNPGFSSSNLMSMLPAVVEECQLFCHIMEKHARKNELFRMEQATTKLTVNIIGKIVLDLDLNAQRGPNVLVDAFKSQVRWQAVGAQFQPSELIDFRRPLIQRYNNWKMDRYLSDRLEERFASRESRGKTKHVIDLAMETYLKEVKGKTGDVSNVKGLDPEFKSAAISNMKTFVFAGHDTTSSTICYALYYLSQNPDMLQRIRKEHEEVFGPDPNTVAEQLLKDGHLLNKLEYTLAVTREVLRIQPPASAVRSGLPGLFLHNPDTGEAMPTEKFMIWIVNVGMHRNPKYWRDPDTFNPERFLPGSTDNKDAWMAFSKGVRNCIGQELALIETKVILAMFVRSFDFTAAYDEVEKLKDDGSGYASKAGGIKTQFGERAYQVQLGTAKPCEGMPCRLTLRT